MSRVFFGSIVDPAVVASDANLISAGEETLPRIICSNSSVAPSTSGTVRFTYFTARKTETINNIRVYTGGTGAAATPTLCRMGLYSVDAAGNLTLGAACANDTTLFASVGTVYSRALTVPYNKVAGQRYAFAIVVVSGVGLPTFIGAGFPGAMGLTTPTICTSLAGQTDLPASVAVGSLASSGIGLLYGEVYP